MFQDEFSDNCLSYDILAAAQYAAIVATRTRLGRPISVEDAQIAAIARSGALELATRNTQDFSDIDGLPLMNPWTWTLPHAERRRSGDDDDHDRGIRPLASLPT